MRLNKYQKKLLAAAQIGRAYGDLGALHRLAKRGLLEIKNDQDQELTITITQAGRDALAVT